MSEPGKEGRSRSQRRHFQEGDPGPVTERPAGGKKPAAHAREPSTSAIADNQGPRQPGPEMERPSLKGHTHFLGESLRNPAEATEVPRLLTPHAVTSELVSGPPGGRDPAMPFNNVQAISGIQEEFLITLETTLQLDWAPDFRISEAGKRKKKFCSWTKGSQDFVLQPRFF